MEDRTYRVMAEEVDAPRRFRVEAQEAGRRLDLFLAERLKLSRAQARRLLARGAVRVDGSRAAASRKGTSLAVGAEVAVEPFRRSGEERAREEAGAALAVLAEGTGWL